MSEFVPAPKRRPLTLSVVDEDYKRIKVFCATHSIKISDWGKDVLIAHIKKVEAEQKSGRTKKTR